MWSEQLSGSHADMEDHHEQPAVEHELIEYDKWEGREVRLADGSSKKKFDFHNIRVPLQDCWRYFSIF